MFVTVEKCREKSLKVPRGVIRNLKSKEDRQTRQWLKDTKGVIKSILTVFLRASFRKFKQLFLQSVLSNSDSKI
jgi:hypothetical protein